MAERIGGWKTRSPVVKLNAALGRIPSFSAAAEGIAPERSMVTITPGLDACQEAFEACERGRAGDRLRRALLPDRL